jgi:hypothetical protein
MSNKSTDTSRNAVFSAARAQGKSTTVVVDAIKACKLNWSDESAVASIADAYKTGRLCASLDLKSEAAATTIFALKPYKDGAGDGHRTLAQHMACRAAISAWSTTRLLAGAPSAQTGGTREPRASQAGAKDKAATTLADKGDISPAMLAVPNAKGHDDVRAFMLRMCDVFTKYQNRNAKFMTEGAGAIMQDFVNAVRNAKVVLDKAV